MSATVISGQSVPMAIHRPGRRANAVVKPRANRSPRSPSPCGDRVHPLWTIGATSASASFGVTLSSTLEIEWRRARVNSTSSRWVANAASCPTLAANRVLTVPFRGALKNTITPRVSMRGWGGPSPWMAKGGKRDRGTRRWRSGGGSASSRPAGDARSMKTLREPLREWSGRCLAAGGFRLPLRAWNIHPLQFRPPTVPRRLRDPDPIFRARAVRACCA